MKHTLTILLILLLVSCGTRKGSESSQEAAKPLVTAVNYPLYFFAESIGGELASVVFPVPTDVDPAYWVPGEEALAHFQSSDLILANGAGYAGWIEQVSLPLSRILNTSEADSHKLIALSQGSTHSHGPEGEHEHTGHAFTTWLDFELAASQARAVKEGLLGILPQNRDLIEQGYAKLEKDLLGLHASLQNITGETDGLNIIGSHPVYQYLSSAYKLHIRSLHFEPGEMPTAHQWEHFDALLAEHPSRLMLWEDEPLPAVREKLLAKGIGIIVFRPCGNRPAEGDFMDVMTQNVEGLRKAISE